MTLDASHCSAWVAEGVLRSADNMRKDWEEIVGPAIKWAENGFIGSPACSWMVV